jgi:hypothetical protein
VFLKGIPFLVGAEMLVVEREQHATIAATKNIIKRLNVVAASHIVVDEIHSCSGVRKELCKATGSYNCCNKEFWNMKKFCVACG